MRARDCSSGGLSSGSEDGEDQYLLEAARRMAGDHRSRAGSHLCNPSLLQSPPSWLDDLRVPLCGPLGHPATGGAQTTDTRPIPPVAPPSASYLSSLGGCTPPLPPASAPTLSGHASTQSLQPMQQDLRNCDQRRTTNPRTYSLPEGARPMLMREADRRHSALSHDHLMDTMLLSTDTTGMDESGRAEDADESMARSFSDSYLLDYRTRRPPRFAQEALSPSMLPDVYNFSEETISPGAAPFDGRQQHRPGHPMGHPQRDGHGL